jgi:hypothetical protein
MTAQNAEPTPTTTGGSVTASVTAPAAPAETPTASQPTPTPPSTDEPKFPANTPVAQMKPEEAAAYWQHQNRKQEGRAEAYHKAAGGKSPEEIASLIAEGEKAQRERMSEQEKAVEAAKTEGANAASAQWKVAAVEAAFDIALAHLDDTARAEALGVLDLSKFVSESGKVDTAKVRQHAERMAPVTGGGGTSRFDFGAGNRGGNGSESGVSAGEALFERRHPKKTTTTP